jgi:hypothetical protein
MILRINKLHLALILATAVLSLTVSSISKADTLFNGAYGVSNWTTTFTNSDGSVDTSMAPVSVTLTGGDNQSGNFGETLFSIVAPTSTSLVFSWTYNSLDFGAQFDPAGYIINGTQFQLSPSWSLPQVGASGVSTVDLTSGDNFGFYVDTSDNLSGSASLQVSGPEVIATPEPSCLALLAVGMIALGALSLKHVHFSFNLTHGS